MLSAACNLSDMCAILLDAGTSTVLYIYFIVLIRFRFSCEFNIIMKREYGPDSTELDLFRIQCR